MSAVPLTKPQKAVVTEIANGIHAFREAFHQKRDFDDANRIVADLAVKAHKLHVQLKKKGHEPRFRHHIYENRGVPPDTVEFYNHVHALEDLLKFLADERANDDPVDRTLDMVFVLRLKTGQYGSDKAFPIKRIRSGWELEWNGRTYRCNREGAPYLTRALEAEHVDFPQGLGGWLQWLWMQAQDRGLMVEEMQEAVDELAAWISGVNTTEPKAGVWAEIAGDEKSVRETEGGSVAGEEFAFQVFSRRWGHEDTYRLKLAEDGWRVEFMGKSLRLCDSRGWPVLYQLLDHDSIEYPNHLGWKLLRLWEKACTGSLSATQVQKALDALAEWVTQTEKGAPCGSIWEGYK